MNQTNAHCDQHTESATSTEVKPSPQKMNDVRFVVFLALAVGGLFQFGLGAWFVTSSLFSVLFNAGKRDAILWNLADDPMIYVLTPTLMIVAGGLWIVCAGCVLRRGRFKATWPYLVAAAIASYAWWAILSYRVQ